MINLYRNKESENQANRYDYFPFDPGTRRPGMSHEHITPEDIKIVNPKQIDLFT